MFCTSCGKQIDDSSKVCPFCGTSFAPQSPAPASTQAGTAATAVSPTPVAVPHVAASGSVSQVNAPRDAKNSKIYVDPNETYVASVSEKGNVFDLFSSNKTMKGWAAIVTDKRLYLRGETTELNFANIGKCNVQKTVDLEDVTGTGFAYTNPNILLLLFGILFLLGSFGTIGKTILFVNDFDDVTYSTIGLFVLALVLLTFGIGCIYSYVTNRHSLFFIEYAGGNIKFDATGIGLKACQDFEKTIRISKELLKSRGR